MARPSPAFPGTLSAPSRREEILRARGLREACEILFGDRAEEKLGHHASATLSLSYEHSPAQLIGKQRLSCFVGIEG